MSLRLRGNRMKTPFLRNANEQKISLTRPLVALILNQNLNVNLTHAHTHTLTNPQEEVFPTMKPVWGGKRFTSCWFVEAVYWWLVVVVVVMAVCSDIIPLLYRWWRMVMVELISRRWGNYIGAHPTPHLTTTTHTHTHTHGDITRGNSPSSSFSSSPPWKNQ